MATGAILTAISCRGSRTMACVARAPDFAIGALYDDFTGEGYVSRLQMSGATMKGSVTTAALIN